MRRLPVVHASREARWKAFGAGLLGFALLLVALSWWGRRPMRQPPLRPSTSSAESHEPPIAIHTTTTTRREPPSTLVATEEGHGAATIRLREPFGGTLRRFLYPPRRCAPSPSTLLPRVLFIGDSITQGLAPLAHRPPDVSYQRPPFEGLCGLANQFWLRAMSGNESTANAIRVGPFSTAFQGPYNVSCGLPATTWHAAIWGVRASELRWKVDGAEERRRGDDGGRRGGGGMRFEGGPVEWVQRYTPDIIIVLLGINDAGHILADVAEGQRVAWSSVPPSANVSGQQLAIGLQSVLADMNQITSVLHRTREGAPTDDGDRCPCGSRRLVVVSLLPTSFAAPPLLLRFNEELRQIISRERNGTDESGKPWAVGLGHPCSTFADVTNIIANREGGRHLDPSNTDLFVDGLHPSATGETKIADALWSILEATATQG